jgi:hypothetical protein
MSENSEYNDNVVAAILTAAMVQKESTVGVPPAHYVVKMYREVLGELNPRPRAITSSMDAFKAG